MQEEGHSRLGSVDSIKGLVQKQTDGPAVVNPARAVLVEGWVVPEECPEVGDHKHEAGEGDQVGCHGHGEALDDHIGVEWLEDVLAGQAAVY